MCGCEHNIDKLKDGGDISETSDTFVTILKDFGFKEKRGAYGVRVFYNKEKDSYVNYDTKLKQISVDDDNLRFSIRDLISYLESKGFQSGKTVSQIKSIHKFDNGGGVDSVDTELEKWVDLDKVGKFKNSAEKSWYEGTLDKLMEKYELSDEEGNLGSDLAEILKKQKSGIYAKGGYIGNQNALMVMNDNKQIKHHTEELNKVVNTNTEVPAWVVSKVHRSASDLSDATHYLDGSNSEFKNGGGVGDNNTPSKISNSGKKMFYHDLNGEVIHIGDELGIRYNSGRNQGSPDYVEGILKEIDDFGYFNLGHVRVKPETNYDYTDSKGGMHFKGFLKSHGWDFFVEIKKLLKDSNGIKINSGDRVELINNSDLNTDDKKGDELILIYSDDDNIGYFKNIRLNENVRVFADRVTKKYSNGGGVDKYVGEYKGVAKRYDITITKDSDGTYTFYKLDNVKKTNNKVTKSGLDETSVFLEALKNGLTFMQDGTARYNNGGGVGYGDIKKEKEKMTSELFDKCGVFFAFSDKQFHENKTPLKEGEKYISIGAGGYMPKGNIKAFEEGMKSISQIGKKKVKENNLAETEILYELNNHECFYTGDYSDVVDMFEGTYTENQIRDVYNKHRESHQSFKNGGNLEFVSDLIEEKKSFNKPKSKEAKVKENMSNGEIHCDTLTKIIGSKPNYPCQVVGSLKLTKCFMKPYYKI